MTVMHRAEWDHIGGRLRERVIRPPEYAGHVVVLGQSGSGKDHLVRWGILPWFPLAPVVVLVTKQGGGDQTWHGYGNLLDGPADLPPLLNRGPDGTPRYVVPLPPGRLDRDVVQRLLVQLGDVGECIVVIGDASRLSTRVSDSGTPVERDLSNLMAEGRELGLTVIACATSHKWAAGGIQDQAAAVIIGQTGGGETLAEFAKIARLPRSGPERSALATLPPHWWLYSDHRDGELWARVGCPPAAGWVAEAWPAA